jgi:hypothetical protein
MDDTDRWGCLWQALLTLALVAIGIIGGVLMMGYLFTKKWNQL